MKNMGADNLIERIVNRWTVVPFLSIYMVIMFFLFLCDAEVPWFSNDGNDQRNVASEEKKRPAANEIIGAIASKSSLYTSMSEAGVPLELINRITHSLEKVFDLKRSSPGDTYSLEYYPPYELVNFEYRTSGLYKYCVLAKEDSFVASKCNKDLDRSLHCIRGYVEGSLWETMVKMGEDQTLISKLADIFEWEIDFLTDVRDGDEFELVIERFDENGMPAFYGDIQVARYFLQGTDHFGILYKDPDGNRDYYDLDGKSLRKTLLKSPLNYRRISSKYSPSRMHPILKIRRPHYGVDYVAKKGTPVVSAGDGRVIYIGWKGDYGKTVVVRHSHGFQTYYGHLSGYAKKLSKGKRVKQGQVIGYVGSTGLSTGPHLDYRVKKDGKYVNPLKLNPPSVKPVLKEHMAEFCQRRDEMLTTMRSINGDDRVVIARSHDKDSVQ
jgi:hypothetical protein